MTTPLLDPEQTELPWEKAEQRYQDIYKKQQEQDTIAASAESLPNDPYYQRLNIIRQDSATATSGEIAADATKKARIAAEKAAELARIQAQAQQDAYNGMNAIAGGAGFGQPGSMTVGGQGGQAYGAQGGSYAGWGSGGAQGVANVIRAAGFPESLVPTFMAIARAESSWNPNATHGNGNGTTDQGLFQINTVHRGNPWYPTNPFDPLQSAKAAYGVYKMQGLKAWTVYNTGAYKQYLPSSVPAIQNYVANTGSGMQNAQVGQATNYGSVPGIYNNGNYGPINTKGLAGNAIAARDYIQKTFPGVSSIGGFGGGSVSASDHPKGKALDVMISNYKSQGGITNGTNIANWFINNARVFGTKYIIWRDRIWQNGVWKPYTHPTMKNDTGLHRDHVHISLL